jgi:hypothetical protein
LNLMLHRLDRRVGCIVSRVGNANPRRRNQRVYEIERASTFLSDAFPRSRRGIAGREAQLTGELRADDGIRTRDPHLGKVIGKVQVDRYKPLRCAPVRRVVHSIHPVRACRIALYHDADGIFSPR